MQISPEQLEAAVLQLPAHVRARLAEVLIQSLDLGADFLAEAERVTTRLAQFPELGAPLRGPDA